VLDIDRLEKAIEPVGWGLWVVWFLAGWIVGRFLHLSFVELVVLFVYKWSGSSPRYSCSMRPAWSTGEKVERSNRGNSACRADVVQLAAGLVGTGQEALPRSVQCGRIPI